MDTPYKLQVKLPNGADFNAEGPQDIVQKAFDKFLAITEKLPSTFNATGQNKDNRERDGNITGRLETALLARAYVTDAQKGVVSLRALPPDGANKASDAAIMILYGAHHLLHLTEFPVTRLKKGLQKSGIQVDRVDRIMEPYKHILIKGGSGVAGKYSLNNQGIIQVEGLLQKIFS